MGAADPLRRRQTTIQALADHPPEPFCIGTGVPHFLATPTRAAVEQRNRPFPEKIAAQPDFIAAVMVPVGVVGVISQSALHIAS
jgi:hypothetical protein